MKHTFKSVMALLLAVTITNCSKSSSTNEVIEEKKIEIWNSSMSYQVEGDVLVKWKSSETTLLDMQKDQILNKVTAIGESAFEEATKLTSIILPSGLKTIGKTAFANTYLESVAIPEGVTQIGEGAFAKTSLASVTIPSSVRVVAVSAFEECENLASLTLNKGTTTIARRAFANCKNLSSVTLPETITDIHDDAFSGNAKMKTVHIKATTPPNLGKNVFQKTGGVTTIYVPKNTLNVYSSRSDWADYRSILKESE